MRLIYNNPYDRVNPAVAVTLDFLKQKPPKKWMFPWKFLFFVLPLIIINWWATPLKDATIVVPKPPPEPMPMPPIPDPQPPGPFPSPQIIQEIYFTEPPLPHSAFNTIKSLDDHRQ